MAEGKTACPVDGRIISLSSMDTTGTQHKVKENQYEVLEFFDVLEVKAVTGSPPLQEAYRQSRTNAANGISGTAYRQTILAFTDVVKKPCSHGFTRREIDAFWANTKFPLLFTTLVNVESKDKLNEMEARVRELYPKGRYLVYYTLDYCEAVIFLKAKTFHYCAELMFKLDYGGSKNSDTNAALLVDSITLCSYVNGFDFAKDTSYYREKFGVYLRFGVADAEKMETFCTEVKQMTQEYCGEKVSISKNWILGRYDLGVFCPKANLRWLRKVKELANSDGENTAPWHTVQSLSILVNPSKEQFHGRVNVRNETIQGLAQKMNCARKEFLAAYEKACAKHEIPKDDVWIRWVHEASEQMVAFARSNMTTDLGICLVPQFLDFFTYEKAFWEEDQITPEEWDEAEEGFSLLFNNISVLVDSMNHSSRQFILTPSFRTVAFDMPPKIMAYYIAMTHRLIDALQDQGVKCGVTISPKFTRNLVVRSLVPFNPNKKDQFITIGIGEESLYRLQCTTGVLAHEISHFVGDRFRLRPLRRECLQKSVMENLLVDLAERLQGSITKYYSDMSDQLQIDKLPCKMPYRYEFYLSAKLREQEAKKLLKILDEYEEKSDKEKKQSGEYAREVKGWLAKLPYKLYNNPALYAELFNFLWKLLILDPDKGTTPLGQNAAVLEDCYNGVTITKKSKTPALHDCCRTLETFSKQHVQEVFDHMMSEYANSLGDTNRYKNRVKQSCDMFREAYADLQAILLLELTWEEYCALFRGRDGTIQATVRPRLLVMALVHFSEDLKNRKTTSPILKEQNLPCKKIWANGDRTKQDAILAEAGFEPPLIHSLCDYLAQCKEAILEHFDDAEYCDKVKLVRDMYKKGLSDNNGVFDMLTDIMEFITNYWLEVANPPQK